MRKHGSWCCAMAFLLSENCVANAEHLIMYSLRAIYYLASNQTMAWLVIHNGIVQLNFICAENCMSSSNITIRLIELGNVNRRRKVLQVRVGVVCQQQTS